MGKAWARQVEHGQLADAENPVLQRLALWIRLRPAWAARLANAIVSEPSKVRAPGNEVRRAPSTEVDESFPIDRSVFFAGPRARAILRGKTLAAQDLKDSGGGYSLEDVRRLLNGVSRQSVEKSVREGRLLAVLGPNNRRFYPVAQFHDDGSIVAGLPSVKAALATDNGYAILNFLVNPHPRLDDRKPIDLLKKGEVGVVVEAARLTGEPGA